MVGLVLAAPEPVKEEVLRISRRAEQTYSCTCTVLAMMRHRHRTSSSSSLQMMMRRRLVQCFICAFSDNGLPWPQFKMLSPGNHEKLEVLRALEHVDEYEELEDRSCSTVALPDYTAAQCPRTRSWQKWWMEVLLS